MLIRRDRPISAPSLFVFPSSHLVIVSYFSFVDISFYVYGATVNVNVNVNASNPLVFHFRPRNVFYLYILHQSFRQP